MAIRSLMLSVCLVLVHASGGFAFQAFPVDGDASLLLLLKDAAGSMKGCCPQGELSARATLRIEPAQLDKGGVRVETDSTDEISLIWRRDERYYFLRQHVREVHEDGVHESDREFEMIQLPDSTFTSSSTSGGGKSLRVAGKKWSGGWFESTAIAPDQLWQHCPFWPKTAFVDFFDPSQQLKSTVKCVIQQVTPQRIQVEYQMETPSGQSAGRIWTVSDLSQGGNIIEAGMQTPELGLQIGKRSYARFSDQCWRLKSYEEVFKSPDETVPWRKATLVIEDFNPEPKIDPRRFTLDSLKNSRVHEIVDTRTGSTKVRRTADAELTEEQLRDSGKSLKAKGFASDQ